MVDDSFEKVYPKDAELLMDIFERANLSDEEIKEFADAMIKVFKFYGYFKGENENDWW